MAGALTLLDISKWAGDAAAGLEHADFTRPLKAAKLIAVRGIKRNFDESHAPDGTPWLPLKRPRANSRGADQPLRNFGILMAASTTGLTEELTPSMLVLSNILEYAGVHNFGATIHQPERSRDKPWVWQGADGAPIFTRKIKEHDVTIPQREFMGLSAKDLGYIEQVFLEDLERRTA